MTEGRREEGITVDAVARVDALFYGSAYCITAQYRQLINCIGGGGCLECPSEQWFG